MCWICDLSRNELLLRCDADVELNKTMHYETTASLLEAANLRVFLPFMRQTVANANGCILTIKE